MKRLFILFLTLTLALGATDAKKPTAKLLFDASKGVAEVISMPQGDAVKYTAYRHLYFVTNIEDSAYQYLNVFVPQGATQKTPIFMRTYIGGYMASAASDPQAADATGRALKEGYVVVIPGSRGRNSLVVGKKNNQIYTGRAPKGLLDLKAAVRYLRLFDKEMLGDAERIITDGTSAGGAMSSLVGATGNNPDYTLLLKEMGAAETRDDVFASVCFCPITDLEHADAAYEWLYGGTDSRQKSSAAIKKISAELAMQFPDYINSLKLYKDDGTLLTADNYLSFIKSEIIRSAQIAKNAGADIPDTIGFKFCEAGGFGAPPVNGMRFMGPGPQLGTSQGPGMSRPFEGMKMPPRKQIGEYIVDLDMSQYLNYVVSTEPLKMAPAFDSMMKNSDLTQNASGENAEFGNANGGNANFTDYSASKNGTMVSADVKNNAKLLNPMSYIGTPNTDVAPHWYIRHGARDRDTAFPIALNLAYKLKNSGKDVNYLLAWNRPHSGDYALDELFEWIKGILK